MKITMTELMVLILTLRDSLSIADGGRYFNFDKESREEILKKVEIKLNGKTVEVEP